MADALRARGKLGPYAKEEKVPKATRSGGASNEYLPPVEEEPVLNVCANCTTAYAADLTACPHCEDEPEFEEAPDDVPVAPGVPYDTWLLADLQDECFRRGLAKSGNKPDLVRRLIDEDSQRDDTSDVDPVF